ncbi:hypothetical protein BGZ65_006626, partial [Modicella reniformis]
MKLSLDSMLENRVAESIVIGLLFQNSHCETWTLELEQEALYIPKLVGKFYVPTTYGGLGALTGALASLSHAK